MGTGIERIVLDFLHAAYGEHMDVEAMAALMADDFIWQLNVPLSPVIRGRDAARAELEKHNQLASGMVEGSEIRRVVSNEDTVVVERLDVNLIAGKEVRADIREGRLHSVSANDCNVPTKGRAASTPPLDGRMPPSGARWPKRGRRVQADSSSPDGTTAT